MKYLLLLSLCSCAATVPQALHRCEVKQARAEGYRSGLSDAPLCLKQPTDLGCFHLGADGWVVMPCSPEVE